MRNLGAIVGILLGIVGNAWQDRSTGSSIALQLVGDDPEWLLALTAQQSAKEPLGCTLIAARLQQNINDITILIHGTSEQKARYLPRMIEGRWTGTMNLTEPHCGTDLGLLRTKAVKQADGSYRITGTKIFISAGEHR